LKYAEIGLQKFDETHRRSKANAVADHQQQNGNWLTVFFPEHADLRMVDWWAQSVEILCYP